MFELPPQHLVRLRPRADTLYASQNRTVLATRRDGFINGEPDHGFFAQSTRLLSRYEYFLNGRLPFPNGLSNVEQHSWLGYYVAPAPEAVDNAGTQGPGGATAQHTIELRLSRFMSDGLHEDVDVTNFTQRSARLTLDLHVDADFADTAETKGERLQRGDLVRPFIEPALKALRWLEEHGDLDRDGFYEYQTRSEQGPAESGLEGFRRCDRAWGWIAGGSADRNLRGTGLRLPGQAASLRTPLVAGRQRRSATSVPRGR